MPILQLLMSSLKPEEVSSITRAVCATLRGIPEADPHLISFADELDEKVVRFDERVKKNQLIEPVIDADMERDKVHRDFVKYVRGEKHHPYDPGVADAASRVYTLLETHNIGLSNESYSVESQHINALLLDIGKPEYTEALTTLKLAPAIDKLKASQQRFEQVLIERSKVDSEITLAPVYSLVNPIKNILAELLESLNTFERRNSVKYTPVVAHVNELISTHNTTARARNTRRETASAEAKAAAAQVATPAN
ncbi:MAG: DUF6261 family protein [Fibrobacterota bacterium]|nr:DUF6261 family protein [Chitinispirillaceae bacterium]